MKFNYREWATRRVSGKERTYTTGEHVIYVGFSIAVLCGCVFGLYWAVDYLAHLILR